MKRYLADSVSPCWLIQLTAFLQDLYTSAEVLYLTVLHFNLFYFIYNILTVVLLFTSCLSDEFLTLCIVQIFIQRLKNSKKICSNNSTWRSMVQIGPGLLVRLNTLGMNQSLFWCKLNFLVFPSMLEVCLDFTLVISTNCYLNVTNK